MSARTTFWPPRARHRWRPSRRAPPIPTRRRAITTSSFTAGCRPSSGTRRPSLPARQPSLTRGARRRGDTIEEVEDRGAELVRGRAALLEDIRPVEVRLHQHEFGRLRPRAHSLRVLCSPVLIASRRREEDRAGYRADVLLLERVAATELHARD